MGFKKNVELTKPIAFLLQIFLIWNQQLILGMIAIFVYVGVEVSTASNLPAYMEKDLGLREKIL